MIAIVNTLFHRIYIYSILTAANTYDSPGVKVTYPFPHNLYVFRAISCNLANVMTYDASQSYPLSTLFAKNIYLYT